MSLAALLSSTPSPRTLVAPLRAGPGVSPALAKALTEALAYRVREVTGSTMILGASDIRAIEAAQAEAAKLGSVDLGALEHTGRALGAGELIEGSLGKVGDGYLLDVKRLDVHRAAVLREGQATPVSRRQAALLEAVRQVVAELYPSMAAPKPPAAAPSGLDELAGRLEEAQQAGMIYMSLAALSGAEPPVGDPGKVGKPPSRGLPSAKLAADADVLGWYRQALAAVAKTSMIGDPYQDRLAKQGVRGYTTSQDLVVDLQSGLAWQRAVAPRKMAQEEGRLYCHGLTLGGRTGFRLPSGSELLALVRKNQEPTIDPAAFPATPRGGTWTADGLSPGYGQAVSFLSGEAYTSAVGDENHVRCVEGEGPGL